MTHLSDEELAGLLDGSLAADGRKAAKDHLGGCDTCSQALAREARADMAMWGARQAAAQCAVCGAVGDRDALRCRECGAAFRARSFRVTGLLAKTDRSRVYRAYDETGRQVALKEVLLGAGSAERLAALEREGRLLQQLRHPRIPAFMAAGFTEGDAADRRYYLAQELVEGESLLRRLQTHRFTEAEAQEIARQVLDILCYLQGLSPPVFHRDIKPANLIARPDGTLSLVDFGSARDLGATVDGTLVGTFGYMPPEQHAGIVDATTDLYALGATLLQLLARRAPWELTGKGDPTQGLTVSEEFKAFLRRLLAHETSARFASAREALAALDGLDEPPSRGRAWRRGAAAVLGFGAASALGYAGFSAVTATQVSWYPGSPPDSFTPLDKVFLLYAVVGGVLFLARLVAQAIGHHGGDHGGHDAGHDTGHHHGDHDADQNGAWKLLTLHGLSAFFLLFGLFGLALSRQSHAGGLLAAAGATVAGIGGLAGVAALFRMAVGLQSSGATMDVRKAVGQEATVYLTIQAGGAGKVHVVLQNRLSELVAVSHTGKAIPTGERVRVVMVNDDDVLVVEPVVTIPEKEEGS